MPKKDWKNGAGYNIQIFEYDMIAHSKKSQKKIYEK
jgi:hypothetical protein